MLLTDRNEKDDNFADNDVGHIVDVSDPTDNVAGTSFKSKLISLWNAYYKPKVVDLLHPPVTITTVGSSGKATLDVGTQVLNIPEYAGVSGGGITSVNGDTGPSVMLDYSDVGADEAGSAAQALIDANNYTDSRIVSPVSRFEKFDFADTADYTIPDTVSTNHILFLKTFGDIPWVSLKVSYYSDAKDGAIIQVVLEGDEGAAVILGNIITPIKGGIYTFRCKQNGIDVQSWDFVDYNNKDSSGGPVGDGITSINGDATAAQELTVEVIGVTALTPTWDVPTAGTHRLSIPIAGNPGVEAGLISNDIFTRLSETIYPFTERQYSAGNAPSAILKLNGLSVMYIANKTSGTIDVYNTLTGELMQPSTPHTGVNGLVYVAQGNTGVPEVWAFGATTRITAFIASTGVLAFDSTSITDLNPGAKGLCDLSTVDGKVYAVVTGAMIGIAVNTFPALPTVTTRKYLTNLTPYELNYITDPDSPHYQLIVGASGNKGIFAYKPSTGVFVIGLTDFGATIGSVYSIKYNINKGKYIATGAVGNSISFITPDSATSFSLDSKVSSLPSPFSVEIDQETNRAYIAAWQGVANQSMVLLVYDMNLMKVINSRTIPCLANTEAYISSDFPNKCIYIIGNMPSAVACKIIIKE